MKINSIVGVFIMVMVAFLSSCGDDDGLLDGMAPEPPRLLSEVVVEDDVAITTYLETHFYNYEAFENPPENFDFQIVIDTIDGDNSDRRSLMVDVNSETFSISSNDVGIEDDEGNITHTLYYLIAREGAGESPTVADSTFVRIEGKNLEGGVFQAMDTQPTWFDLPGGLAGGGTVRGFSAGVSKLRTGGAIINNEDGTFEIQDYGVGLVIIPSGLGFFNIARGPNLPQYTPIMFTIDLFAAIIDTDHDRDGIPSIQEDLNNDGNLRNDNTDNDVIPQLGPLPNYLDPDDDNDGIPTRDEIEIAADGTITFPDSDNDGTPDYLDSDS